jgi:hypothetical protein
MTRIWRIDDDYPEELIGAYDDEVNPDRFQLKQGAPVVLERQPLRFTFASTLRQLRRFDDLANSAMVPLVSRRLAALLREHAAGDTQLLPALVQARDAIVGEYVVVNATRMVPAVDFARSEFSLVQGTDQILRFERLALVPDCLGKFSLARCSEYKSFLLVSEALARLVVDSDMRGMGLYLPEQC